MARKRRPPTPRLQHIPFPEFPTVVAILEWGSVGPLSSELQHHPYAEINVMLEGHGVWHAGDDAFEVRVGDAFLLMPGTLHHADWPAGVRFKTGTVDFGLGVESKSLFGFYQHDEDPGPPRSEEVHWLWGALARKPVHRLRWEGFPEWWRRIFAEQEAASGPYRALRIESAMLDALSRFADPAFAQPEWGEDDRRGIERALRHISGRLTTDSIPVPELAQVAGMSRSRFAELFHSTLGMPPHAYVIALRMWMARAALAGSQATAATIAGWLGFSSPQHFSRAFKTATGLTPQGYRRRWAVPWLRQT